MEGNKNIVVTYAHFGHHHPLQLLRSDQASPSQGHNPDCSGCGLPIASSSPGNNQSYYYSCKADCPFRLHQLCYNMPKKTRHSSHPAHPLTLLPMPLSSTGVFKCTACRDVITGFYYTCADCTICFHILCTALPFSLLTTSHSHPLKLDFSPPTDIFCDVCNEPCDATEWIYRCRICDYDTHLDCAIADLRLLHSKPESNEAIEMMARNRKKKKRKTKKKIISNPVAGWDERVNCPKTNQKMMDCSTNRRKVGIGWASPNIKRRQATEGADSDISTLLPAPGDSSSAAAVLTPSPGQFSDGFFSIDLQLSHSGYQLGKEARSLDPVTILEIEAAKPSPGHTNKIMLEKITANLVVADHRPSIRGAAVHRDSTSNPEARSGRSCLGKLFRCCC